LNKMHNPNQNQMEYRYLGNSGIKVSVISFGNWLNSDDPQAADRMKKMVRKA
jgi:aryl-alcohol dehydrogenase-like predicted oxidoreductase